MQPTYFLAENQDLAEEPGTEDVAALSRRAGKIIRFNSDMLISGWRALCVQVSGTKQSDKICFFAPEPGNCCLMLSPPPRLPSTPAPAARKNKVSISPSLRRMFPRIIQSDKSRRQWGLHPWSGEAVFPPFVAQFLAPIRDSPREWELNPFPIIEYDNFALALLQMTKLKS